MMEWAKIKDIAESIKTGKTPPTKELKYFDGEVNWYTPGDLDLGKFLKTSSRTITELSIEDKKAIIHKKGTLLVGCIGNIGKIGITTDDCSSNQQITGIYPNKNTDVHYLYYWFRANKKVLDSYSNNAVVPILNNRILGTVKIPLPPLAEQKRIANILDQADQLRQLNQQILAEYDALTKSLFLDMFGDTVVNSMGWEVDLLGDVVDLIMGQSPKGDSYNDKGEGSPLLNGPTEFGMKYPIEKQWTSLPKKFSKKGDILFCVRGATAGRMNWSDKEYCIGRGLAAIRVKGGISKEYIYLLLERMYDYFQKTSNGSTFINISRDDLKKIKIPRTSIDFQNKFAKKIKNIEAQKANAQAALVASEDLFNNLLQKAFKGEL